MKKCFIVVFSFLLLVGCVSHSGKTADSSANSFVVTLQNGKSFRITPDLASLKNTGYPIFHPESLGLPVFEQFKRRATERIMAESLGKREIDITKVRFAHCSVRDASGQHPTPPIYFVIGDYAMIEELK